MAHITVPIREYAGDTREFAADSRGFAEDSRRIRERIRDGFAKVRDGYVKVRDGYANSRIEFARIREAIREDSRGFARIHAVRGSLGVTLGRHRGGEGPGRAWRTCGRAENGQITSLGPTLDVHVGAILRFVARTECVTLPIIAMQSPCGRVSLTKIRKGIADRKPVAEVKGAALRMRRLRDRKQQAKLAAAGIEVPPELLIIPLGRNGRPPLSDDEIYRPAHAAALRWRIYQGAMQVQAQQTEAAEPLAVLAAVAEAEPQMAAEGRAAEALRKLARSLDARTPCGSGLATPGVHTPFCKHTVRRSIQSHL